MALGFLRMSEQEFLDTTWRSLHNRFKGWFEVQENRERAEWERVRWQTTLILNLFAKKGRSIKPTDIVKFPWDRQNAPPRPGGRKLTAEELKQKFERYDKIQAERYGKIKTTNGRQKQA